MKYQLATFETIGEETIIYQNIHNETKAIAVIDSNDLERCVGWTWHAYDKYGHVAGSKYGEYKALHRFIVEDKLIEVSHRYKGKLVVDHIDRNPANNRKSNLRIVPEVINLWNRKCGYNDTPGVYELLNGDWVAEIRYKDIFNKREEFHDKESAIQKRQHWEKQVLKIIGWYEE